MPKTANFKGFSTLSWFWRESSHWLGIFDSLKWKFRLSLKSPRKPHVREKSGTHFFNFFCKRGKIFEWSIHLEVNISRLVSRMDFILHIQIVLDGAFSWATILLMLDHSKVPEMYFWMIQSAKKEIFVHFLDLSLLDWLDIAYNDRTKWVSMLRNGNSSWGIVQ